MTGRNSNHARWTDENIEQLLVDFYRQETPRELPPLKLPANKADHHAVTVSVGLSSDKTPDGPRRQRIAGLAVAACLLMLFATVLSPVNKESTTLPSDKTDDTITADHQPPREAVIATKPNSDDEGPGFIVVPDGYGPLRRPDRTPLLPELTPWWHDGLPAGAGDLPSVDPPKNDWLDRLDIRVFPLPEKRTSPKRPPRLLPEQE